MRAYNIGSNRPLFSGPMVTDLVSRRDIEDAVGDVPSSSINDHSAALERLYQRLRLKVPVPDYEQREPRAESTEIDVSRDPRRNMLGRRGPLMQPATLVTVRLPFTGDGAFFFAKPNPWTSAPAPVGTLTGQCLSLQFVFLGGEEAQATAEVDAALAHIRSNLVSIAANITEANQNVRAIINARLRSRASAATSARTILDSLRKPEARQ